MNPNNSPGAYGYQPPTPYGRPPGPYSRPATPYGQYQPRPFIQEDTIREGELDVERKTFVLTLKENPRGRFLRITEHKGSQRNSIIIPSTGLKEFQRLLVEMVAAAEALPPSPPPPAVS